MRLARRWLVWLCLALPAAALGGATISVPRDYATIKSAVLAAAAGDTIEVDDGYYFEDTIILDKPLTLKARHPFRTIVCGTGEGSRAEAILIIRSSVVIDGLLLRNGVNGILQRDSPDVDWHARNLVILKMERAGISINDPGSNIGRGRVENLIVDSCDRGIEANDAYGFEVVNGFISRCRVAVRAYNHLFFRLRNVAIWDCRAAFFESQVPVRPPRTNTVTLGPQVAVLDYLPGERDRILKGFLASPRFFGAPLFSGGDVPQEVVSRGIFLSIAGDILLGEGDDRRAAEFYEAALLVERALRSGGLGWKAHGGLAACLERQGQLSAALAHYRESLDMFEVFRQRIMLQHNDAGFYADKLNIYLSLIQLLLRLDRQDPSAGYLCQILAVMERSKARGFIDSLEEAELGLPAKATPGLRQEEGDLSRAITRLQVQLHNPYLSDPRRLALEMRLQEAENAYTDLLARLRRKVFGTAPPPVPEPLSAKEIRDRLLDRETALIEYMLGPDGSVALLATAGSLSVSLLPGRREIRRLTENYLGYLTVSSPSGFHGAKGGARLNELLLGPFAGELRKGTRKIIVVPDGELIDLPFEALVDSDGRYLVEKYEFSYVHSASALAMLKERSRRRTAEDLLAVGVSQPPRPGSSVFQFSPQLSQLRYVSNEVREVGRGYIGGKKHALMDAQAEEGALKRLNWTDYRVIHFAVHAIFDPDHWTRSSLLLWQNGPSDEDGYFQVRDIFPLSLASDLVVLSACQTAKAGLHSGEDMAGLSNIFLFAGSRSVLVSQWNINDRSTAVFMRYFYDSLASGREVGAAVREAKTRMIRSKYRHPFYWAAFNLIGCSSGSYSTSKTRDDEASSRLLSSRARMVQR